MGFIRSIFNKAYTLILRLWKKPEPEQPKKRKKIKQRERTHTGAHYYLGDLLDQLEGSFKSLDTLKKVNRSAYNTFSKVSCHVTSQHFLLQLGNQYNLTRDQIPSVGCSYLVDTGDERIVDKHTGEEWRSPCFCYFRRVKNPINVQQSNGLILEVCLVFEFEKGPEAVSYYASVNEDMTITPLKELRIKRIKVDTKVSRKNNRPFSIQRASWMLSPLLQEYSGRKDKPIEKEAEEFTWMAINSAVSVDNGVQVRVAKGSKRVTFAIDMLRTPYFFKDRDKTVNENGKTQKIFHIVAGHKRMLSNGEEVAVKTHFRGIRKFTWNGFKINILLNGKHVKSFNKNTADALEVPADEGMPDGYVDAQEVVNAASEAYDRA